MKRSSCITGSLILLAGALAFAGCTGAPVTPTPTATATPSESAAAVSEVTGTALPAAATATPAAPAATPAPTGQATSAPTTALTPVSQTAPPDAVTPLPDSTAPPPAVAAATPIYGRSTGEISTPIRVLLILSKAPRLEEPAQVTLVITAAMDAPGTTAEILLSPGAVATEGDLTWTGDLAAQQTHRLQAAIKFVQEGDWELQGKALRPAGGGDVWGDLAAIYLHVTRESGQVGFPTQPNVPHSGGQAAPTASAP